MSALHSLKGSDAVVSLEIGMADSGKIGFYMHGTDRALRLAESQMYAQYPDIDALVTEDQPFLVSDEEEVLSMDLRLTDPEVFPIKRHPQFDDLLTRVNVDPLAGITSTLARYPISGMRGHVSIIVKPIGGSFRRRSLRFLPLLTKGLSTVSVQHAKFFTRMQLARGFRRILYFPVAFFLGGFRAWPGFSRFLGGPGIADIASGASFLSDSSGDPEKDEMERASARSHDREGNIAAAQDKVNRLLFVCTIRISVIAPKGHRSSAEEKLREIAGSFRQFALPQCNSFKAGKIQESSGLNRNMSRVPQIFSVE